LKDTKVLKLEVTMCYIPTWEF